MALGNNGTPQPNGDKLRALADSTYSILFTRLAVFLTPFVFACFGYLLVHLITDLESSVVNVQTKVEQISASQATALGKAQEAVSNAERGVDKLGQKLDDNAVRQADIDGRLQQIEQDHENRLRFLEHH